MGFIYSITSPSGKIYIGQTRRNCNKRFEEHFKCPGSCIILEEAIRKYGKDKMICDILLEINDNLLDKYECRFISLFNSIEPNGYNIRSGGSFGEHSDESKKRMSEAKLGSKNHNYGKPRSDTVKYAIAQAKSGEKHHFYGKTFTEDHKLKLSKSHKTLDLPMYVCYIKERPEHYCSSGYAVINHPILKNKYFTSKKINDDEKLNMAINYLNSA